MATIKASFTIEEETIERVKELADKERRSVSQMVTILLEHALDRSRGN